MARRTKWALLLALGLVTLIGCERCDADVAGEGAEGEAHDGADDGLGVIEGIVRLAPGEELPSYPESPTSVPNREPLPAECTPSRARDSQPVRPAEESGGLINLAIVLTDDAGEDEGWPSVGEPQTHELTIRDCRTSPPVIVAARGDLLHMANDTDYPFFPDFGGGMLQALLRQEPRDVQLDQGGVRTVMCAFAAPCGRTEVITVYHRLATVSGEDGRFRIEGVPTGRAIRVTAWHPLFIEARDVVTLEPGQTAEVELTIRPAEITPPPPPPERPPGHPEDTTPPGEPF